MHKFFASGASPAPFERLKDFFVKKSNNCGLLTAIDIPDFMEYVAYKQHTSSWFMWFINHNLHVKRLGDFGTFCLVLACGIGTPDFIQKYQGRKGKGELGGLLLNF